ncbi:calcium homeostasis modulator protein 3-like [Callorhinchus milii]|uniref:calcium homeostasis modulator protein 3-like n=1 Tax=Callorhinchus milii TaxID=7868 RepID=UPI0004571D28|nr:calcium homeostasis modulator protein 3-like [Callorhinchus milii]|eukprot:gi/632988562/ref/XP_007883180.1/ PREDICTED: protein FAM26D-like [Callorhinchus milii]
MVNTAQIKKGFLKDLRNQSTVLGSTAMFFVLAVVEELLEMTFSCPCEPNLNKLYVALFFCLPSLTFAFISAIAHECPRNCSADGKKAWRFVVSVLAPPVMWLVLLLLDGDYLICAKSPGTVRIHNVTRKQGANPCEAKASDGGAVDNADRKVVAALLQSQLSGGIILLIVLFIVMVVKCYRECCSDSDGGTSEMEMEGGLMNRGNHPNPDNP